MIRNKNILIKKIENYLKTQTSKNKDNVKLANITGLNDREINIIKNLKNSSYWTESLELFEKYKNKKTGNIYTDDKIKFGKFIHSLNSEQYSFIEYIQEQFYKTFKEKINLDCRGRNTLNFKIYSYQVGRLTKTREGYSIQIITKNNVTWIDNLSIQQAKELSLKWLKYYKAIKD